MTEVFCMVVSENGRRYPGDPSPLPVYGPFPSTTTIATWPHINGFGQRTGDRDMFYGVRGVGFADRSGGQGDARLAEAVGQSVSGKSRTHSGARTHYFRPQRPRKPWATGAPNIMIGMPLTDVRYQTVWRREHATTRSVRWQWSTGEDASLLLAGQSVTAVYNAWVAAREAAHVTTPIDPAAGEAAHLAWLAAFERDPYSGLAIGSVATYLDEASRRAKDYIASVL